METLSTLTPEVSSTIALVSDLEDEFEIVDYEEEDYQAEQRRLHEEDALRWKRPNELNSSEDRYLDFVADLGFEGY